MAGVVGIFAKELICMDIYCKTLEYVVNYLVTEMSAARVRH